MVFDLINKMLLESAYQWELFFMDYPTTKFKIPLLLFKKYLFIKTTVVCLCSLLLLITALKCVSLLITGDCLSAKIVSSNPLLLLQSHFFLNRFAYIFLWTMQFLIPNYVTMLPFDLSLNKDKLEHVVKMCCIFFI